MLRVCVEWFVYSLPDRRKSGFQLAEGSTTCPASSPQCTERAAAPKVRGGELKGEYVRSPYLTAAIKSHLDVITVTQAHSSYCRSFDKSIFGFLATITHPIVFDHSVTGSLRARGRAESAAPLLPSLPRRRISGGRGRVPAWCLSATYSSFLSLHSTIRTRHCTTE